MRFKSLIKPYFRDHVFVGRSLIFFDEIDSTNLFLLRTPELLKEKGIVIQANRQTKGIGRKGRTWETGKGGHLFCSFVIAQAPFKKYTLSLPLLAGLAVYNALTRLGCKNLSLKWPNDVLLNEKKVCGILCQSTYLTDGSQVTVCGIGINILGDYKQFSKKLFQKATTLEEHGIITNSQTLLKEITIELESVLKYCHQKGIKELLQKWEKSSNSIGQKIKFNYGGKQLLGRILGLDHIGRLKVLEPNSAKVYKVESGEIEFYY